MAVLILSSFSERTYVMRRKVTISRVPFLQISLLRYPKIGPHFLCGEIVLRARSLPLHDSDGQDPNTRATYFAGGCTARARRSSAVILSGPPTTALSLAFVVVRFY